MKTTTTEITTEITREITPEITTEITPAKKKLNLKRETVYNLTDQLLTSQGHSLWTCDTEEV